MRPPTLFLAVPVIRPRGGDRRHHDRCRPGTETKPVRAMLVIRRLCHDYKKQRSCPDQWDSGRADVKGAVFVRPGHRHQDLNTDLREGGLGQGVRT